MTTALLGLALAVAGCGGAGSNEEGGGGDGGGDDGGGGTGLSAPAVPSGLEATPQDGAVQLGWDAVDGADTYNVYRSTSSGVDISGSALNAGVSSSEYTDETAEEGTEYFYVVTAVASEDGETAESGASEEASAALLASPSGLSATPEDGSTQLSWEAAGGADTYNVYRSTSSGVDASSDPLGNGISSTEYTDETAQNGTEYFYVVTAVSPSGRESDPSGEASTVPFASPSGLSATPGDGTTQLSWEAADGAGTYRVYRSTSSEVDVSGSPLDTGISSVEYTDETAQNGTEYFYVVTAVSSSGGESDASGEAAAIPFAAPSGLEGTSRDSEVALSWDAAGGADTYNVYRSTSSTSGAEGEPLATGVAETSYADGTAENGTKYYYRVTSVNTSGAESSASSEVEKTPFSEPPGQP
ncbi:fibronectin type III domain-containing protein [Salinibacter ruber]|uniref:fibronectin type III domain-containing protein n=1 Tax=Salinibacter ruber TaxID=146919 RepID=UPI002167E9CE|nr:cellulose 1,4-beta-cellobiosidase [Salinibacter ruber]